MTLRDQTCCWNHKLRASHYLLLKSLEIQSKRCQYGRGVGHRVGPGALSGPALGARTRRGTTKGTRCLGAAEREGGRIAGLRPGDVRDRNLPNADFMPPCLCILGCSGFCTLAGRRFSLPVNMVPATSAATHCCAQLALHPGTLPKALPPSHMLPCGDAPDKILIPMNREIFMFSKPFFSILSLKLPLWHDRFLPGKLSLCLRLTNIVSGSSSLSLKITSKKKPFSTWLDPLPWPQPLGHPQCSVLSFSSLPGRPRMAAHSA